MDTHHPRWLASSALAVGAILGMAGTFMPSASLRGLCWGIDGTALIIAAALLALHHFRQGRDVVASGFLVFAAGETRVGSGSAMELAASGPVFGAGAGLWAAALALISVPAVLPAWLRMTGTAAALIFAVVAAQIYSGQPLTPLSQPLPFFAYPVFALTLFGWAFVHQRGVA